MELVFAASSGTSYLVTWKAGGRCFEELILAQLLIKPTLIHLPTLRIAEQHPKMVHLLFHVPTEPL